MKQRNKVKLKKTPHRKIEKSKAIIKKVKFEKKSKKIKKNKKNIKKTIEKQIKRDKNSEKDKDIKNETDEAPIKKYPPMEEYKSLLPKKIKDKTKSNITPIQIQRMLNTGHPDDLYITLKLLNEDQSLKLLTYFRKHHTVLHKKKDLSKAIIGSKTKTELLTNVKNYLINSLKKEYEDLKQQTSNLRKKGKDVLIEDLRIMSIPSKIRFFEATEDKHDFYVAQKLLDKMKQEIALKA